MITLWYISVSTLQLWVDSRRQASRKSHFNMRLLAIYLFNATQSCFCIHSTIAQNWVRIAKSQSLCPRHPDLKCWLRIILKKRGKVWILIWFHQVLIIAMLALNSFNILMNYNIFFHTNDINIPAHLEQKLALNENHNFLPNELIFRYFIYSWVDYFDQVS